MKNLFLYIIMFDFYMLGFFVRVWGFIVEVFVEVLGCIVRVLVKLVGFIIRVYCIIFRCYVI